MKDYSAIVNRAKQKKTEDEKTGVLSTGKLYDATNIVEKTQLGKKVNFDTFASDLQSVGSTIGSIYGGWQTQETMHNTKSVVESMQKRVNAYQEYQRKYGSDSDWDISDIASGYQTALDDWDGLTSVYGNYQNADAFNTARKKAQLSQQFSGLSYDDVQTKKKEFEEDSDEYKFLSEYGVNVGYNDLRDYDKELESLGLSRESTMETKNVAANSPLSRSFSGNTIFGDEYGMKLAESARRFALDHAYDSYKDYPVTEESSQYKEVEYDGLIDRIFNQGKDAYEYVNRVHSQPSELIGLPSDEYGAPAGLGKMPAGIENMTKEEVATFNSIADAEGYDKAFEFLKDMEVTLSKRGADKDSEAMTEWLEDGNAVTRKVKQGVMSAVSVPAKLVGGIEGALDDASNIFTGEEINPYNSSHAMLNTADTVRETTSENIGEYTEENDWVGTDLPLIGNAWSFGYDTGLSIAESALGVSTFGEAFTPIMGMGAFSGKAKELKEAGASENQVVMGATAAGVAEAFFEKFSIDRLLKAETSDSVEKIAKNFVKQTLTEASEEMATEFANAIVDLVNRQNTSDIMKSYNEYLEKGYSEKEAIHLVHMDVAGDIAIAGIGGALSGGVMGSVSSGVQKHNLSSAGKQIAANDRIREMMELSANAPKESELYSLYNEYKEKGITADNIDKAQLGNLYATAKAEGMDTGKVETKKTAEEKKREERAESLHTGETTEITSTGNSVKLEGVKLDDNETTLMTSEGEVSVDDVTLSANDAELVAYAEGMSEEKANLFISQYDGKSKVDDYATSFELVYTYGEAGSDADSVLANKGVLTERQALEVYKGAMKAQVSARQAAVDEITKKYSNLVTKAGTIDDSVIDYESQSTDENKINWNSLTANQRFGISYAILFAQATGMNLEVFKGKNGSENGTYDPSTNTIRINAYAGYDTEQLTGAILPAVSHETTHWMEAKAPAVYREMQEVILNTLAKDSKYTLGHNLSVEDLIAYEQNRIKQAHPELGEVSKEYAINEIVARACEDMLSGSEKAKQMIAELSPESKKTLADKIREVLSNIKSWINEMLSKYKSKSREAEAMRRHLEEVNKLQELWDKALEEAVNTNNALREEGRAIEGDTQYSEHMETDSEGNSLSAVQMEFFKDSKIRDAEGRLKVMYHGSGASFTIFDKKKARSSGHYGSGFYFTDSATHAKQYGSNFEVYLNITNPLQEGSKNITKAQLRAFVQEVADNEDYGIENYGYGATVNSVVSAVYGKEDFSMLMDINATCIGDMVEAIRLFNEVNSTAYDGIVAPTETVAFYPNQIKNTDNKKPTNDMDIRYSDGDTNEFGLAKYTKKEIENWSNSNILYANSEQDIMNYVENHVKTGENTRLYCGKISGPIAERIKKDTGYDLESYNVSITSSFENSHADEASEALLGQIAMTPNEVAKFPYIISDYDVVALGGNSKENNPVLKFEKVINGRKIAVTYILTKRRMLKLQTIYGWAEKKNHLTATDASVTDANARTSMTNSDIDSNNIVSHSKENAIDRTIRFSDSMKTDSEGNTLSVEQVGYFKNVIPELRDSQGRLKVLYHGTTNQFTQFNYDFIGSNGTAQGKGFYLSDSRDVANGYTDHDNVTIMELYARIEKPMSLTRKTITKAQFKKFIKEVDKVTDGDYLSNYGDVDYEGYNSVLNAALDDYQYDDNDVDLVHSVFNASSLDWEEGFRLLKKVLGYDGVVQTDFHGTGASVFVPTLPEQIKAVTNTAPTNHADIRFSDAEIPSIYEVVGENEALKKQNAKLAEDVARLAERLKLEKKVTGGNTFNEKQLRSVAGHLLHFAQSTYSVEELTEQLREIYTYIVKTPALEWDDLMAKCYEVAKDILDKQRGTKVTNDYFKGILSEIRGTRISLSEEQIQEAKNVFGDRYRDAFMGRVILAKDGISLDQKWQEWSTMYPEIFDADITGGNQIIALSDAYENLREASEVYQIFGSVEDIRALANEIYNQYWNVSTIRTTADKYDKQIKELNFKHRQMMSELRAENKKKLENQRIADDIHYKRIINNIRKQNETRVREAKESGRRRLDEHRDRAARNAKIQSITKKALKLNRWLVKNSKDEHIPEVMKEPVVYLLNSINFASKQLLGMQGGDSAYSPTKKDISLSKALEKVHDMVQNVNSVQIGESEITEIYGTFADFPMGFADDIKALSGDVNDILREVGDNEYVLNQMSLEQLESLDKIITTMKATVTKMNKFLAIRHAEGVAHLSKQSITYLDSLGKGKVHDKFLGKVDKMLDWGNSMPYFVFKRFGEGAQKVYESLQNGWDKFAFHVKEIIDYAESIYTSKEVKEWEKDIKSFDVLVPATEEEEAKKDYIPKYQKIQMSVPQIMSLYCLQKREQAKSHLMGGGMRITDITTKKGVITQTEGVILSESEIDMIVKSLTVRQKEVADALQRFMNTTCSEWGNEVSMLRFGIKQFEEENYFPIQSDKNNLAVNDETEQNNSLFRLLNMSFTKGLTKKANNRVVISDIFDVFAQHSSDMAKYNALALPVLDAFKWYNYKEKAQKGEMQFTTKSLKQSLENAFGKDGQNYFVTFLRDINGEKNVGRDTLSNGFFTNAKIASVGFNLKVMALQPTSYVRASAVIDTKYLVQAFGRKPKVDMAEKYCGIALWKSLGFYDINVQRGVTDLIKHDESWKDKFVEKSMKGAEIADKVTWGYLWNACEAEVRDTHKSLKVGGEEYYEAVAKRLREIIYSTQVVDSTMTRSQMMRSSDGRDKMLTAFASEPTLAYNMLQDCYFDWKLTARQTGSKKTAFHKHGKKMARVFYAYAITNAITALLEVGFEIFRDDEEDRDEKEILKMFLENFALNNSILNKIPYAKEAVSILQGFTSTRMDTQWMQYFSYTIKGVAKLLNGEGNAYTTAKNGWKGLSYLSGLPAYNAIRDITALLDKTHIADAEEMWNDTIGSVFPSLKSK